MDLLLNDQISLFLPVWVYLEEVLSSSTSLSMSFLAACRPVSGFRIHKYGRGRKRSVQDSRQAIRTQLSHRAHFLMTMEDVKYIRHFAWSYATLHKLFDSRTNTGMTHIEAWELALKEDKGVREENDFEMDFSRIQADRIYRSQCARWL